MSTVSTFVSGTQTHQDLHGRCVYAYNTLDFSATNVTAADVVQAVKVPAKAMVTRVSVIVRTAEGGVCTATVGDGDNTSGWDASSNFNATSGTVTRSLEATDTFGAGKYYASEDTIDLVMGNNATASKVTVIAEYCTIDA